MDTNDSTNSNQKDKNNEGEKKSENKMVDNSNMSNDTITYYYNREERLKKLRSIPEKKHVSFFRKGSKRTLLIILVDVMIVSLAIYLINKPTNLYETRKINKIQYELNISGIRGKKVMVALTIINKGNTPIKINKEELINLHIIAKNNNIYEFKKKIGEDTTLNLNESTSVVFLIKENMLPKVGNVKLYIGNSNKATFSNNVRFYYINL